MIILLHKPPVLQRTLVITNKFGRIGAIAYNLLECFQFDVENDCNFFDGKIKALHSELLTKLSSRFSSRNEFFAISEVRV
jgi:hypothetical protein